MASKYIKNSTGSDQTWVGQLLSAGEYYQIQDTETVRWQNDSSLLTAIGSGDALVAKSGDGNTDIADVAAGINYLKDMVGPVDLDGAPLMRTKITKTGWHYQIHGMELRTSVLGSLYNKDYLGSDLGISSIKFYNSSDVELIAGTQAELDANCTKTVVDWEAPGDIELIGGTLDQAVPPAADVRLWIIAIPDLPLASGGSIPFTQGGINLRYLSGPLDIDGKTPKLLPYNGTYHTSKFRIILKHDAGTIAPLNVLFKLFRENI